jgi:hypothetical protein
LIPIDRIDISLDLLSTQLLNSVSDFWTPVRFFGRKDIEELLNKSIRKARPDEIAKRLGDLIHSGLIVAKSKERGQFIPDHNELIKHIFVAGQVGDMKTEVFLGLTPLGGNRWETITRPEWNKFTVFEDAPRSPATWLEMSSKADLKEALAMSGAPAPTRVATLKVLKPWQPVYWKYLPI